MSRAGHISSKFRETPHFPLPSLSFLLLVKSAHTHAPKGFPVVILEQNTSGKAHKISPKLKLESILLDKLKTGLISRKMDML